MTDTNFIPQSVLREVADELQVNFEFNLTSRSPLGEVAEAARERFADRGLCSCLRLELCHRLEHLN